MNRFASRSLVIASVLIASLASTVAMADPNPAQGQQQQAHPHRQHGGGGGILDEALRTLSLRQDQRQQIETVKAALHPSREAAKLARKEYGEALAAQVQSGTVSRGSLQAKSDAVVATAVAERAAERNATERLHAILSKEQRAQLANEMEARLDRAPQHAAPNAPNGQPAAHAHGGGGHLAKELKLTQDQKDKVRQIAEDEAKAHPHQSKTAMKEKARRVFEAFKGDTFVMDQVTPNEARDQARANVDKAGETAEKVTPILTAEQRGLAATKMRQAAAHGRIGL